MSIQIEVELDLNVALEIQHLGSQKKRSKEVQIETGHLLKTVNKLGITLTPRHPGQDHPLLAPYFSVEVNDSNAADKVIEQLLKLAAVKGAYIGPQSEPPF